MEQNRNRTAGRTAAVLFALLLWHALSLIIDNKIMLVSPVDVLIRMTSIWRDQSFLSSIWFSFSHIVEGFLLALAVGTVLAVLSSRYKWFETLLWPFLVTVKTVPVASFVVICLIWLSAGRLSVFISFLIVLPVIYGNLLSGLKSADVQLRELAEVFGMPPVKRVCYIWLPQLKPFLLSACETALGMAWKAGVAAEIIGTPDGSIGKQLYYAKIYLDTDDLLCWTLIIVILSVGFEKLFMLLLKNMYRRLER